MYFAEGILNGDVQRDERGIAAEDRRPASGGRLCSAGAAGRAAWVCANADPVVRTRVAATAAATAFTTTSAEPGQGMCPAGLEIAAEIYHVGVRQTFQG